MNSTSQQISFARTANFTVYLSLEQLGSAQTDAVVTAAVDRAAVGHSLFFRDGHVV
jgi:hypothetical protein